MGCNRGREGAGSIEGGGEGAREGGLGAAGSAVNPTSSRSTHLPTNTPPLTPPPLTHTCIMVTWQSDSVESTVTPPALVVASVGAVRGQVKDPTKPGRSEGDRVLCTADPVTGSISVSTSPTESAQTRNTMTGSGGGGRG
jgi:hypothetical protein